jgi:hypothetical protein
MRETVHMYNYGRRRCSRPLSMISHPLTRLLTLYEQSTNQILDFQVTTNAILQYNITQQRGIALYNNVHLFGEATKRYEQARREADGYPADTGELQPKDVATVPPLNPVMICLMLENAPSPAVASAAKANTKLNNLKYQCFTSARFQRVRFRQLSTRHAIAESGSKGRSPAIASTCMWKPRNKIGGKEYVNCNILLEH